MSPASDNPAIDAIIDRLKDLPGALLPILHEIQHTVGYVPAESVPAIAQALSLSRAEVHGVISFYHHFHTEPMCQHTVQICRAEACQAVGAAGVAVNQQAQGVIPVQAAEGLLQQGMVVKIAATADKNTHYTVHNVSVAGSISIGPGDCTFVIVVLQARDG